MEAGRQLRHIAVHAAGVIVARRLPDFFGQGGQLLDELPLLRGGQQRRIRRPVLRPVSLGGERRNQGADPRMGILHIIHRVFAVLPHREVQVKLDRGLGPRVEEIARRVNRHFIQQVGQRNRLPRALGHGDGLSVPHQLDQLHQHDVEAVLSVQIQRVHRALQPGDVPVVIGAPDVDGLVKAPNLQLVAVVGDIRGKIGIEAVAAAQHVVLQVQLGNGLFALPFGQHLASQNFGRTQPERSVLLVGKAQLCQPVDGLFDEAALVQLRFKEPAVILHAVAQQVRFHPGDVPLQAEVGHGGVPLTHRLREPAVSLFLQEGLCQLDDVLAVIAVLGKGRGLVPQQQLLIPCVDGRGKLFDLIARVVDIELPADLPSGKAQHRGQRIAQHAAPGIAQVHRAGRVGGHEFHIDRPSLSVVDMSVVHALLTDRVQDRPIPAVGQTEIDKAGPGNRDR